VSDPGENRGAKLSANDILEAGAKRLETELAGNPLQRGRLAFVIGNVYLQMGEDRRAAPLFDRAIDLLALGEGDAIERSKALRQRAFLASRASEFEKALVLLGRADALLGADDKPVRLERAFVAATRANTLRSEGRYEAAIAEFRESIRVTRELDGEKSSKLGSLYNNLGLALQEHGDLNEAIDALQAGYEVHFAAYGSDHPRTLSSAANLAAMLSNGGKHELAIGLASRVVATDARVLGGRGAQFGYDLNALGVVQFNARRFAQALATFDRAAQVFADAGGPEQEGYAQAVANKASCLLMSGDARHALEEAQRALKIRQAIVGADHRNTRLSQAQVAEALLGLERRTDAYAAAQAAAAKVEALDPPTRAVTLRALALAEAATGRAEQARAHAKQGLAAVGTRPMLSPEDAQVLADLTRLAGP
jgi:tetratricopeptide (TPR) repeat protein